MNANSRLELDALSSKVIGCAFEVSNSLGCGFLEKVYENAMTVEFRSKQIGYSQQQSYLVRHKEEVVGEYIPDLVVEDAVVIEIKAQASLTSIHEAQCMNYLRASNIKICLLLNFGLPRVQVKRLVWKF
jgi:GxxExxY protein